MFQLQIPDHLCVFTESAQFSFAGTAEMQKEDIVVKLKPENSGIGIRVSADTTPVTFVRLRWEHKFPAETLFLGDAWERAYGDLQWRTFDSHRFMPWYFLAHFSGVTAGCGVRVCPGAMAVWNIDPAGITLSLDLRNGTRGVILKGREIAVAVVVSAEYPKGTPFDAAKSFCKLMCSDPLPLRTPVYGGNNWYYAYGDSSHGEILADSRYIASLSEGLANRPFMVIDDGWEIMHQKPGNSGPWTCGNEKYPDMQKLADEMRSCGVRPGIWMRPLWNIDPAIPEMWKLPERNHTNLRALDPSRPEVIALVEEDIRRLSGWGYELIKHDFSTNDIFGRWGWDATPWLAAEENWHFADRSRTSAEIVVDFYKAILGASHGALILGCNTIGHLGAGLMHIARIGDDTSGNAWGKTRKMGVNSLAFRLCQHKAFFEVDADCVGITGKIPWQKNRQWTELLACSSTPFFASIRPGSLTAQEFAEMKQLFAVASRQDVAAEPVNWLADTLPEIWRFDGKEKRFHWYSDESACLSWDV